MKWTAIWLDWNGKNELDRKTYKENDQPATDKSPTKNGISDSTCESTYTFTGWDNGVEDNDAHTKTYTPLFTAEFVLYLDEQKDQKLVVSVERIPGQPDLKMKKDNISGDLEIYEETLKEALKEALESDSAVAKSREKDSVLYTLDFRDLSAGNAGIKSTEDHNITLKGESLKDLPDNALLYSVCYEEEQNKYIARKIDYVEKNETNPAENKLTFQSQEVCTFVFVLPGEHVHVPVTETAVDKAATCETKGSETIITKCSECGEEIAREEKTLDALGHDWQEVSKKDATCTEPGTTTYKCTKCNKTKTETTQKAFGHAWDNGVITKQPTCVTSGEKVFTCKNDKTHTKKETLSPTDVHTAGSPVVENRVEAKVGQAGSYDEVVYCKTCKKELSRKKVTIPALTPTPTATPTPQPTATPVLNNQAEANIALNNEVSYVAATAENAPANAYLSIRSVDPSVIELVESSRIKNKTTGEAERYDVWFGVDVSLGMTPANSVTITLQSQKLASLPDGALLYHVNPLTNKVRKTAYTYSKAEGKISFKSRDFSPFVILVKHDSSRKSNNDDAKDAAADNNIVGGAGVPTYGPVGDNGTGYSGYGGYNGTGAHMTLDANDTSVLDGMGGANATGVNDTKAAGFNDTKYAGENGTNTTNTTMGANVTEESNSTGVNKTAVKEKDSGNSSGGLSTGAVIGIIAAIVAAAAVAFGVYRYLKNGRREEE